MGRSEAQIKAEEKQKAAEEALEKERLESKAREEALVKELADNKRMMKEIIAMQTAQGVELAATKQQLVKAEASQGKTATMRHKPVKVHAKDVNGTVQVDY